MQPGLISLAIVTLALGLAPSRAAGDLIVESWELDTGIHDSTPQGDNEFAAFSVVENPFQDSHTAILNNSYTTATYDFGWSGDSAHFDVSTNHHQQQLLGSTESVGQIHLIPAVDSIITAQGTWQYAWPNSARGDTDIFLDVYDLLAEENIVDAFAYGGNEGLGPPHGTLYVQGSGLLLAGREYEVYYDTTVYFYTPTPSGDASGEVHFNINPVPESASLALLAIVYPLRRALLLAPRRRRR